MRGGPITADNASRPEGIYSLEDIVRTQKEQWSPEEHPRRRKGDHREAKGTPVGWVMPNMLYFQAESRVQAKSNDFFYVNQGEPITADSATRPEGIYSLGDIARAQKEQQWSPEGHP